MFFIIKYSFRFGTRLNSLAPLHATCATKMRDKWGKGRVGIVALSYKIIVTNTIITERKERQNKKERARGFAVL